MVKSKSDWLTRFCRFGQQQYHSGSNREHLVNVQHELEVAHKHVQNLERQVKTLKKMNSELREKYKFARTDQRNISPLAYNTAEGMDSFFANSDASEPYIKFGKALRTLLKQKQIELNDKHVLDVGIGPGIMLKTLLEGTSPASITGLDFSPVAVSQAERHLVEGVFKVANVYERIPYKADFVLCTEVLEHLEDPELALNNILETVRPGGKLLLTVPDGRIDFILLHINFWSPESWRFFIEKAAAPKYCDIGQFRVSENSPYNNNYAIISR